MKKEEKFLIALLVGANLWALLFFIETYLKTNF